MTVESLLPERIGSVGIRSVIGEGGMGVVYLGLQENLNRDVAVKTLKAHRLTPEGLARFRREADLISRLFISVEWT